MTIENNNKIDDNTKFDIDVSNAKLNIIKDIKLRKKEYKYNGMVYNSFSRYIFERIINIIITVFLYICGLLNIYLTIILLLDIKTERLVIKNMYFYGTKAIIGTIILLIISIPYSIIAICGMYIHIKKIILKIRNRKSAGEQAAGAVK